MKRIMVVLMLLHIIQLSYSYTDNVHEFIGIEASKYLQHISSIPVLDGDNSVGHQRFINGTINEDESDWIYGFGAQGGADVPNIPDISEMYDWPINLEQNLENEVEGLFKTITHFWDSDNLAESQIVGHGNLLIPSEFTLGPVPTAMTKAKRMVFGNGDPFFWTHTFIYNSCSLVVYVNDASGTPLQETTFESPTNAFIFRIKSLDDFLINHNVIMGVNNEWVHLSVDQFNYLRNSPGNPEYEYLGRLSHLLMDMCVPAHAHGDMHAPALKIATIIPEWTSEDCDYYEGWKDLPDIIGLSDGGYLVNTNPLVGEWECQNVFDEYGYNTIPLPSDITSSEYLLDLFFATNQITQRFASEDVDGNSVVTQGANNGYPFVSDMFNQINQLIGSDVTLWVLEDHNGVDGEFNNAFPNIRDFCIPLAIRATASLMEWWSTRYGYVNYDVQSVNLYGNITNIDMDYTSTTVRMIKNSTGEISETTPDASGHFNFSFTNPSNIYIDMEIYYEQHHPIFVKNFLVPGHQNQSEEPLPVNIGSYTLQALTSSGLHVGRGGYSSFQTIEEAIYYAFEHDVHRIQIAPGNYSEKFIIYLPDSGFSDLEICGSEDPDSQTTLYSWGNSSCHVFEVSNTNHLDSFTLRNLIIDGRDINGGIQIFGNIDNVLIEECIIQNCYGGGMIENYPGAAIQTWSPAMIRNCKIYNNRGKYLEGDYYNSQGVIFITGSSIVEKCFIYNNLAADAGAIYITGSGNTIHSNSIYNNRSTDPNSDALAIKCQDDNETQITNNIFYNNGCIPNWLTSGSVISFINSGEPANKSRVINNTFTNTMTTIPPGQSYPADLRAITIDSSSILELSNNVFMKYPTAICNNSPISTNNLLNNDLFWINACNFAGSSYNIGVNLGNCFFEDPLLNSNYKPIWNSQVKSPCIDNGNPDTNGDGETWITDHYDRDSDGTQMDIGAIPLIDGHIHRYNSLTNDKVRYISIPGVVNYPGSGEQNSLYHVFHEFRNNGLFSINDQVLDRIWWKYNDDENFAIASVVPDHHVCSQNGYKVILADNADDVLIQYQGFYPGYPLNQGMFIQDIERYTAEHYILPPDANSPVDSNTGIPYREIYLGYYLEESLRPFDTLNPILSNITAILAEDWAMARVPIYGYNPAPGDEPSHAYTNTWLGCFPIGDREITINPGEMVVVRYIGNDPIEFKLGGDNPDPNYTDAYYREMASHFGYEEQPDYVPIFLSIDLNQYEDGNKPSEIAVFVDDECKGAAVIKEGEVQLNAYITNITDPTEELKNLEFRMYFPNKAANPSVLDYSVLNNQSGCFESRNITVSECKEFLQIRIGATEEPPQPTMTQLFNNYPNPFNPVTTISFDHAEQGFVTIEVFNIKGQKVRTLVKGSFSRGHHSVVWNGTDNNAKYVSSGVYFYRMSTPNHISTRKMLLLK